MRNPRNTQYRMVRSKVTVNKGEGHWGCLVQKRRVICFSFYLGFFNTRQEMKTKSFFFSDDCIFRIQSPSSTISMRRSLSGGFCVSPMLMGSFLCFCSCRSVHIFGSIKKGMSILQNSECFCHYVTQSMQNLLKQNVRNLKQEWARRVKRTPAGLFSLKMRRNRRSIKIRSAPAASEAHGSGARGRNVIHTLSHSFSEQRGKKDVRRTFQI